MTTQHPTASRTRLPILIAAWLFIIAATVTMSSGLPGTAQAQAERGAIPSLTLHSTEPGQLVISWESPDPAPTDYRIRWANTDLGWPSWSGTNETERANEYPLGGVTSLTLNNLTPGDSYKVQIRSRYYNADRSVHESSGPWTNTATQRVKNNPPAAPTGLIAARIGHSVLTLTWDDPQDDTITGYRILRGTEADNLAGINSDTASNATEYEDDTVAPETAYNYAVLARSANGEGTQSDIISATTPQLPSLKSSREDRVPGRTHPSHRSSWSATCPKLPTKTPRTAEITDRPSPLETTAPVTALPASPSSQEIRITTPYPFRSAKLTAASTRPRSVRTSPRQAPTHRAT